MHNLVLDSQLRSFPVPSEQLVVGESLLRILVQKLHVRVGWRVVEKVVKLLDVLAMVAFLAAKTVEALFENAVLSVPQSDGKADVLVTVADAAEPVFIPPVHPGAGMLVRQVFPGFPVSTVVFAYRSPGPFAQVCTPSFQVSGFVSSF